MGIFWKKIRIKNRLSTFFPSKNSILCSKGNFHVECDVVSMSYRRASASRRRVGEGTLPWAIFRFWIFSNYFLQKFWKIKTTLLHMNSASKKIWHLAQGRVLEPCLGPYICISINTKWRKFSPLINGVCS